ncbi:hypothetical protein D3C80_2148350 [compost metagenome]
MTVAGTPANRIVPFPNAPTLAAITDGEELPHHALLDATIIAGMFSRPTPD